MKNKNPMDFNYKVRLHHAKGEHFMHWRVERIIDGMVWFINPAFTTIAMQSCFLRNQKGAANKIFSGGNKTVCAWIECKYINIILSEPKKQSGEIVSYNPKVTPNWVLNGKDVDYNVFTTLTTHKNKVFTPKPPEKIAGAAPLEEGVEIVDGCFQRVIQFPQA